MFFIVFATLIITGKVQSSLAIDKTIIPGNVGQAIVQAVVHKIRSSQIFPEDYDFLFRAAYVESHFGDENYNNSTTTKGIWQFDEEKFNQTQSAILHTFHEDIKAHFKIPWQEMKWSSTSAPFISGLAAILHCQLHPEPIPQAKSAQARHWLKYFTTRKNQTISFFLNAAKRLEMETPSYEGKLDVVIILDGAANGSLFLAQKQFAANLFDTFSSDNSYVRKGAVVTGYVAPHGIFGLTNSLSSTEQRKKMLQANPSVNNYRLINDAIDYALGYFNTAPCRIYPKVLIILTTGPSFDGVSSVAEAFIQNITTLAISIGNDVPIAELEKLSGGNPNQAFKIQVADSLLEFVGRINREVGTIPLEPPLNQLLQDQLGANQTRLFKFKLPAHGLVIDVQRTYGAICGYYSFKWSQPNEAIHDGFLRGTTEIPNHHSIVYLSINGLHEENSYGLIALPRQPPEIPRPDFTREIQLSDDMKVKWETYLKLEKVIFMVEALTKGFVAFGISHDGEKVDFVIGGIKDDGTPYFAERFSMGKNQSSKIDKEQNNWRLIEIEQRQNSTFFKVIRSFVTGDEAEDLKILDRSTQFYWAIGENDELKSQHSSGLFPVNILQPEPENFQRTENFNEFFQVTWKVNFQSEKVTFDVHAITTGYIGFGLSTSNDNEDADVIIGGVGEDLMPYFSDRHLSSEGALLLDQDQNWLLLAAREKNGTTQLKFIRDFKTGDDSDISFENQRMKFIWTIGATDEVHYPINWEHRELNILQEDF